jgi:hypothetical protein
VDDTLRPDALDVVHDIPDIGFAEARCMVFHFARRTVVND